MLAYSKNKESCIFNNIAIDEKAKKRFIYNDEK